MDEFDRTAVDRLTEYLDYKNIPAGRLEKMAGLGNGYFRKSKGSMSSNKLADILHVLQDLNGDWLLTGRGKMLRNEDEALTGGQNTSTQAASTYEMGRHAYIKYMTGSGNINAEKEVQEFKDDEITFETDSSDPVKSEQYPTDMKELRRQIFKLSTEQEKDRKTISELNDEIETLKSQKLEVLETQHELTKEILGLKKELKKVKK